MREVERAARIWNDAPWATIRRADLRALWRQRIAELRGTGATGLRGAEITAARVLAVAQWLRDEELIPSDAGVPRRTWKEELRNDWLELSGERSVPAPNRPRHTLEEMRQILLAARAVDPRFHLLMVLGAEVRLGQVVRCRRSDLDLAKGLLTVHGRRGKRGVLVELTAGQRQVAREAVTTGYLRELERIAPDYPLFPAGQMPGGRKGDDAHAVARHLEAEPVNRKTIHEWFHAAEVVAKVPSVAGRAAYGVKRAAVDAVKAAGISREGLMAHAGWTDTQMADRVYADQQAEHARHEAAAMRAKIRGEETPQPGSGRTQDVPTSSEPATDGYAGSGDADE
jgi:integrase